MNRWIWYKYAILGKLVSETQARMVHPAGFCKRMLEIETATGWVHIPTQERPPNGFHGPGAFYIADDPTMPAYQALRQAGGKKALFRLGGRTQQFFVEFNKEPMLLEKQIAKCVFRLSPAK